MKKTIVKTIMKIQTRIIIDFIVIHCSMITENSCVQTQYKTQLQVQNVYKVFNCVH